MHWFWVLCVCVCGWMEWPAGNRSKWKVFKLVDLRQTIPNPPKVDTQCRRFLTLLWTQVGICFVFLKNKKMCCLFQKKAHTKAQWCRMGRYSLLSHRSRRSEPGEDCLSGFDADSPVVWFSVIAVKVVFSLLFLSGNPGGGARVGGWVGSRPTPWVRGLDIGWRIFFCTDHGTLLKTMLKKYQKKIGVWGLIFHVQLKNLRHF